MKNHSYTIPLETDDSAFLYYEVKSCTDEILASFYTNKVREGKFYFDAKKGIYTQTQGTCDFKMPTSCKAAREKLFRMVKDSE